MRIVEYLTEEGDSPFAVWFDRLDGQAAAKVTTALVRLGHGNTSNVESVGGGVFEKKIAPAIASTSGWMEQSWSSWSEAGPRNVSRGI